MATYQELGKIYKDDGHAIFVMALNILYEVGAAALKNGETVEIPGNVFSEEYKTRCIEIAGTMANTDATVLGALIQRVVAPFTDPKGERIPHLHLCGDEDDVCPVCGSSELEYQDGRDIRDDGTMVSWVCPYCNASGAAGYIDTFDRHYNVIDANGNAIHGRPE